MGGCVSVHRESESRMKLRLSFGSKTDKLVIPSPVKEKSMVNGDRNGDRPTAAEVVLKSQWSTSVPPAADVRDFDSKEEAFFDSQPWMESDCDDDFLSVKGDFTPSRGNTPVHHSFSAATTPQVNRALVDDKTPGYKPEPSPKKKLIELFKESLGGDQDFDDHNISGDGTLFVSGANSMSSIEKTPNRDYRPEEEKPIKFVHCCLPRMLSSRSFRERNKMSPLVASGN
ncbi:hypothetical protein U1Q18_012566 [Sarracenia purpurea var. burkii]